MRSMHQVPEWELLDTKSVSTSIDVFWQEQMTSLSFLLCLNLLIIHRTKRSNERQLFFFFRFQGQTFVLFLSGHKCNDMSDFCPTWWQRISPPGEVWPWSLSGWKRQLQEEWLLLGFLSRQVSVVYMCVRTHVSWEGSCMESPVGGMKSHLYEASGSNPASEPIAELLMSSFWKKSCSSEAFLSTERSQVTVNPRNTLHVATQCSDPGVQCWNEAKRINE